MYRQRPALLIFYVLLLFITLLFLQPEKVGAFSSYQVDRFDDDATASACTEAPNDCSLRGAIIKANTSPGEDSISLPAGTYILSITGSLEDNAATGDLDLIDSSGLIISGENGAEVIIQQTIADRVLDVISGNLSLSNIIIKGGNVSAIVQNGGAIRNRSGASLMISSCTFTGNLADRGGAIANEGGTLSLNKVVVDNNRAVGGGGGINNQATLNVVESVVSNNATGPGGFQGAGIYNSPTGVLTVSNSLFWNNDGTGAGAGIANSWGTVAIANTTFYANHTTSTLGGGAIMNYGNMVISNSTIKANEAIKGTGIFNTSYAVLTISNTIIENELAGGNCFNQILDYPGSPVNEINADSHNISIDATCGSSTVKTSAEIGLGTLADYGGSTPTIELLSGSAAIDAGDDAICAGSSVNYRDQRGVTRPQEGDADGESHCDVGAYERIGDDINPEVTSTNLYPMYHNGPSRFSVSFDENMWNYSGGAGEDDVTNADNYLLVEAGENKVFDTSSCGPVPGSGGIKGDDERIGIVNVTYHINSHTAYVNLEKSLPVGNYRLYLCGTSTLRDLAGNPLNNGADEINHFTVTGEVELPATGFPKGIVTSISQQPLEKSYQEIRMVLEIPALHKTMPIVGVPNTEDGWDVSWLGEQAGYLEGTAFPTWQGNTVLTGHVWSANNQPGPFTDIKSLKYGDEILIRTGETTYIYQVRDNQLITPTDVNAILRHEELDWITLLTCEGYESSGNDYLQRRMLRAVLVRIE